MRTHASHRAIRMLALTCLLILTCTVLANAQDRATAISQKVAPAVAAKGRTIPPIAPTSQIQLSGKVAGKLHMVITFLETKSSFSRGVSSEQFVRNVLQQMSPAPIPPWLRTYLLRVYNYHVEGVSPDVVYAREDGRAFSELYNTVARTYKPGMTKAEFEQQLVPGVSPDYGDPVANKPKWINALRKIIDIIDDIWPEDK